MQLIRLRFFERLFLHLFYLRWRFPLFDYFMRWMKCRDLVLQLRLLVISGIEGMNMGILIIFLLIHIWFLQIC